LSRTAPAPPRPTTASSAPPRRSDCPANHNARLAKSNTDSPIVRIGCESTAFAFTRYCQGTARVGPTGSGPGRRSRA
jgi:hypothetical protein